MHTTVRCIVKSNAEDSGSAQNEARLPTGVPGLDEILHGGLLPRRSYLVRGTSGTGKTTIGAHFLTGGASPEDALFLTLSETRESLVRNAGSQGIELGEVRFLDLTPATDDLRLAESYTIFETAEVEGGGLLEKIADGLRRQCPERVFIDSLTQLRFLAPDAFQFRKQVLSILRYLTGRGATVLFTSETSSETPDDDLRFLSDGILSLDHGKLERTVQITKMRGADYRSGMHHFTISSTGVRVYPRLEPGSPRTGEVYEQQRIGCGEPELDRMLHGGLDRATVSIITGPSGVGKTTLGLQYMKEAASRSERSVVYTFEENPSTLRHRCTQLSIPVAEMLDTGLLAVEYVEPLGCSPDEFTEHVREEVEQRNARIVMLDSLSGYRIAVGGSKEELVVRLHALCRYLTNRGVTVIVINEVESITSEAFRVTEGGISYLGDTIVMLRYLELNGEIEKCIGVLKKRTGDFDKGLRRLSIGQGGISAGRQYSGISGILKGTPVHTHSGNGAHGAYSDSQHEPQ